MQDQFGILARWLIAVLAVMGLCGLLGCWMLFRMWWRRQYRHDNRPPQQTPDPAASSDLWQLSGQRLLSKMNDQDDDDPSMGRNPNRPSPPPDSPDSPDLYDDTRPFDDTPPWR